jgi:branched-subunit amino acid transport protein
VSAAGALVWTAVAAIAIGTWAFRASFVFLFGYLEEVPPWVDRTLRFIPPAIIAAIIAPRLLVADGSLAVDPGNERLLAGAAAFAVAWYTEDIFATIVAGMVVLWVLVLLL